MGKLKNITYKNHPMAKMKRNNILKTRGKADLWTLFITGTRKNLEDYLSYLIWFKKTLPLVNRKRKPQNRISWDEGTIGWNKKKTGCEAKATSWDEMRAWWDKGGAQGGKNNNFKMKITLEGTLPHTRIPYST